MQFKPKKIKDPKYSWLSLRIREGNITSTLEKYIYRNLWNRPAFSKVPIDLFDWEYAIHLQEKFDESP